MSIAILMITDGRDDYLVQAIDSTRNLHGDITERWMFDDTGDEAYRDTLRQLNPTWGVIGSPERRGASGAVTDAWRALRDRSDARYVFHLEQDFVINLPVDLDAMAGFLDAHPHIAQVVLRRQAWNPDEKAAGGVLEQHPDWYYDMSERGVEWLEHRAYWSNNPCLYRADLLVLGWPEHVPGRWGEDTFHQRLLGTGIPGVPAAQVRYAYWGRRDTQLQVTHIGHARHHQARDY